MTVKCTDAQLDADTAVPRLADSFAPDSFAPDSFAPDSFAPDSFAQVVGGLGPFPIESERIPHAFRQLLARVPGPLPRPGNGNTLQRWRALAAVAAADLSLVKLFEGHTDAMAIMAEVGVPAAAGAWGVWAADPPDAVATFHGDAGGGSLNGRKAWCSGAGLLDHALLTARTPAGSRVLVQVALKQPGIHDHHARWQAVGMAATHTGDVDFMDARASRVGDPGAYLQRPGFWHGAVGIAACWYGASCAIAAKLRDSGRVARDPHARAHLGAVDACLYAARCALEQAARDIDLHPTADARELALRVRAIVEAAATETLARVGRALGAAPLCVDAAHAQRCADLTTFLRQSHAESDLETLGELVMRKGCEGTL